MTMANFAKVVILSPLPQLDKEFDYEIPEGLMAKATFGMRVLVPFGRNQKDVEGFIVSTANQSSYVGKLSRIKEILSDSPEFHPSFLKSVRVIAGRSIATVGEILKLALGSHMPRVVQRDISATAFESDSRVAAAKTFSDSAEGVVNSGSRYFFLAPPFQASFSTESSSSHHPSWAVGFVSLALKSLELGKSTLILVPDFRELGVIKHLLVLAGVSNHLIDLAQDTPRSKAFQARYLATNLPISIAVGLRGAVLTPVRNLGTVLVFDEADDSFTDQSSPYLSAREMSLVRQAEENFSLVFSSNSVSTNMFRLISSGYVKNISIASPKPRIVLMEDKFGSGSATWKLVRDGLARGSVLIQVANRGQAAWLTCKACSERAVCSNCNGPIGVDDSGRQKCRWCNAFMLDAHCQCGSNQWTLGRAGSNRTASEFGKAFPGAKVIEATGESKISAVDSNNTLVISTPGAEPYCTQGYEAVLLLDAAAMLIRPQLTAKEDAIRKWSNAIAKLSKTGIVGISGLSKDHSRDLVLWDQFSLAKQEFHERAELALPPSIRLASFFGKREVILQLAELLKELEFLTLLGPTDDSDGNSRLLAKYPYAKTIDFVTTIKGLLVKIQGSGRSSASGRPARAVKVNMDDVRVI